MQTGSLSFPIVSKRNLSIQAAKNSDGFERKDEYIVVDDFIQT